METYEVKGADWTDRYARAHIRYALQLMYSVELPDDWDPPTERPARSADGD